MSGVCIRAKALGSEWPLLALHGYFIRKRARTAGSEYGFIPPMDDLEEDEIRFEAHRLQADGCWHMYHVHLAQKPECSELSRVALGILNTSMGGAQLKYIRAAADSLVAWIAESCRKQDMDAVPATAPVRVRESDFAPNPPLTPTFPSPDAVPPASPANATGRDGTGPAASGVETDNGKPVRQEPRPFSRGELVFFADHVELCGANICSGRRSKTRRRILELLAKKQEDGRFVAYSLRKLTNLVKPKGGSTTTVVGQIRDIRDDITDRLREKANISCGHTDVIQSGGPGYRFAQCITVRHVDPQGQRAPRIKATADDPNVRNEGVGDVPNVPKDTSVQRRKWILQRLEAGHRLRALDVAEQFDCSVKTGRRDLTALKNEDKIWFDGASRTGFYRLRPPPGGSQ